MLLRNDLARRALIFSAAAAVVGLTSGGALVALGPYAPFGSPDANTIYLYHLNNPPGATLARNAGSSGLHAIAYDGNPSTGAGADQPLNTTILGATGFTNFGRSANIGAIDLGLGVDMDANGGFRLDSAGAPDRQATHASIFGAGNAFTLEAMINLSAINLTNREIIATDNSEANTLRGFQFRVNNGNLEFNFVAPNVSAVTAVIPTTGPDAFVANQWFHTALVYDGANAQFYWTRVDAATASASPLEGLKAEAVDVNAPMPIVIGNEARDTGGGVNSNEGLRGLIDEVRISNVARAANQFIFSQTPATTGDVDGLGGVTIADFNIIKNNLFNNATMRTQGDLNDDGIVDFFDFREWKTAAGGLGEGVSLFGGEAPEPASGLLAVLGAMTMVLVGRRRKRSHG